MPNILRNAQNNRYNIAEYSETGAMAESADATDLKSVDGDIVRVRPPLAPQNTVYTAVLRKTPQYTGIVSTHPKR